MTQMTSSAKSQRVCLAIADISGYTRYLQGVELEHAQDVIADLLGAIINPMRPAFRLNKLEGDAAFLYSPVEDMDASVVLDMLEGSYFGFRRRLLSIGQASACECGACSLIPQLDLKLVVHTGTVIVQELFGMTELVGEDVILVHRLLKNSVAEETGAHAYALLTDATVAATGLEPDLLGMTQFSDEYSDVGAVTGWVHDLDRAWKMEQARRRIYVAPEDAVWTSEEFVPDIPVAMAWEWITRPSKRLLWEVGFDDIFHPNLEGRRGLGAETHCVHGQGTIKEEVVDWRPPKYVTYSGSFEDGEKFFVTDEVVEAENGVLVRKSARSQTHEGKAEIESLFSSFAPLLAEWLPTLAGLLREELSSLDAEEVDLPQPDEAARLASAIVS